MKARKKESKEVISSSDESPSSTEGSIRTNHPALLRIIRRRKLKKLKKEQQFNELINIDYLRKKSVELKLDFDSSRLSSFIALVKNGQYNLIAREINAPNLALAAFKKGGITYDEIATILYLAQNSAVYLPHNLTIHKFLDDSNELTAAGKKYLLNIYTQLETQKLLPLQFQGKDGKELFLKSFISKLKESPSCANYFYDINIEISRFPPEVYESDVDDLHDTALFNIRRNSGDKFYFLTPSYAATEAIGHCLYGRSWIKMEYLLGEISPSKLAEAQERKVRVSSISIPGIVLPARIHELPVSQAGYTRHDQYHRLTEAVLPEPIRKALQRMIFVLSTDLHLTQRKKDEEMDQNYLGEFTKEKWILVDKNLEFVNKFNREISNEMILSNIFNYMKRECSSFDLTDPNLDTNHSSVAVWLIVMDMVNSASLWENILKIDIKSDDLILKNRIDFYKQVKDHPSFKDLNLKQKIFILQENYYPLPHNKKWTVSFDCPESKLLTFIKNKGPSKNKNANIVSLLFTPAEIKQDIPQADDIPEAKTKRPGS